MPVGERHRGLSDSTTLKRERATAYVDSMALPYHRQQSRRPCLPSSSEPEGDRSSRTSRNARAPFFPARNFALRIESAGYQWNNHVQLGPAAPPIHASTSRCRPNGGVGALHASSSSASGCRRPSRVRSLTSLRGGLRHALSSGFLRTVVVSGSCRSPKSIMRRFETATAYGTTRPQCATRRPAPVRWHLAPAFDSGDEVMA